MWGLNRENLDIKGGGMGKNHVIRGEIGGKSFQGPSEPEVLLLLSTESISEPQH